jgi:hypothetical protein
MRRQPFTEVRLDAERMNAVLERASAEENGQQATSVEGVKKKTF